MTSLAAAAAARSGPAAPRRRPAAPARRPTASASGPTAPASRRVVEVMGTVVSLVVAHHRVPADHGAGVEEALTTAAGELHDADAVFSTYRPGSDVSRLRRGEISLEACSPRVAEVLAACASAEALTGGAFSASWDGAVDPTGLVKGWAAQRASTALHDAGFPDHAVGAGGDVVCAGLSVSGRCWQIGVADPHRPGSLVAVVEVGDGAVATSGTTERGGHVLDPRTGAPARGLASATVIGPDLAVADALATAAVAEGRADVPWMGTLRGYEVLTVDAAGHRWGTRGLARHLAARAPG